MQDLEYTPSDYFPHTANKNTLSAQLLFELTVTAQKHPLPIDTFPNLIHLSPKHPPPPQAKLKTEDFFEEFENNFVVTFEEERPSLPEELTSTATFHLEVQSHCLQHSKTTEVAEMEAERRRDSFGDLKLLSLKTGISLMDPAHLEEKGSPVAFEVKKRTVFKAKENIFSNAQNFKLTKKKIFNHNIFEQFAGKSKACPHSTAHSEKSLPSKSRPRRHNHAPTRTELQPRPRSHPTILERHIPESRSSTLNNWRKRFNREKQAMEGTNHRENIFHIQLLR